MPANTVYGFAAMAFSRRLAWERLHDIGRHSSTTSPGQAVNVAVAAARPEQAIAEVRPEQEFAEVRPGQEFAEVRPGQEFAEVRPGQEFAEVPQGQAMAAARREQELPRGDSR
jgi:hypothetical protein